MGFYAKRWKWDMYAVFEEGNPNPIQTGTIEEAKNRLIHEAEMAEFRADRPTLFSDVEHTFDPEWAAHAGIDLGQVVFSDWTEDEPDPDDDWFYERRNDK